MRWLITVLLSIGESKLFRAADGFAEFEVLTLPVPPLPDWLGQ